MCVDSLPPLRIAAFPVGVHIVSICQVSETGESREGRLTGFYRKSGNVYHNLRTSFEYDQEHADWTSDAVELEVIVQLRCIGDTARGIRELCDVCHTL